MGIVLLAFIIALVVGVILALIIGAAAKAFAVEPDLRKEALEELLPGANCGGCGFPGCGEFAKALLAEKASPELCPVCLPKDLKKVGEFLGISVEGKERMVALIKCGGHDGVATRTPYTGVNDCASAALVAVGGKGCAYGCLGLASCVRACAFDAIEIRNGLAVVHPDRCTGCGQCVATCPQKLICMVPASVDVHVYCNSPEKGGAKRKVCKAACIACQKCVKAADEGQMRPEGFLVQTNDDNPPGPDLIAAAACPTDALKLASQHALAETPEEVAS